MPASVRLAAEKPGRTIYFVSGNIPHMKAMILGAGIGSRLDPLTRSLPEASRPIVGKPVMGHLVDLLKKHGVTEVMVNVQYLGRLL
jgi:NDP-sugar pyrophosphorylase family protein